jgi:hypothetical protein
MYNHQQGKEEELKKWIKSKFEPFLRGVQGVQSVETFMRSWGLGPEPTYQTWIEIPNFAFLDKELAVIKSRGRKILDEGSTLWKDWKTKVVFQL